MDMKSIVSGFYQVSVIVFLAVGYSMLGKKILKMAPLNIQKFSLEDAGKLGFTVTASDKMRDSH